MPSPSVPPSAEGGDGPLDGSLDSAGPAVGRSHGARAQRPPGARPGAGRLTPGQPTGAARQAQLRAHNLAVALGAVVDAVEPLSRAGVAATTGLARGTVSGLVDQLVAAGLVRELDPVLAQRAGRPAVPLVPAGGTLAGLGLEVNVDYLGARAVDLAGQVLVERVVRTDLRGSDPAEVMARLAGIAAEVLAELRFRAVRVAGTVLALPGLVDRVTGPLRVAPNLGWRDVDVVALAAVHPALGGLRLGNEANLAARAEAHARRGAAAPSFVYVSGEVGIGGALVLDGELFAGRHGWSGEIGHVVVDAGPPVRTLEAVAGQDALLRAAGLPVTMGSGASAGGRGRVASPGMSPGVSTAVACPDSGERPGPRPSTALSDPSAGPLSALLAALAAGDRAAHEAVRAAGRALGVALASVTNVVDAGEVVLGGTFRTLFPQLHDEVAAGLADLVISAPWSPPRVSRARVGEHAAMSGGALTALRRVLADPTPWLRPS